MDAAMHGYAFLRDRLQDKEHGGFFWETDASGEMPTRPDKHMYGQAYALYALSELARATDDPEPLELARRLFEVLDERTHDAAYGGYLEFFRRDWAPVPDSEPSYMLPRGGRKQLNTHLHLMEAFTEFVRATGDSLARDRLLELILIQSSAVVRKTIGACTDLHERNWTPLPSDLVRINFGHDIENVWLLHEACAAAGFPDGPLLDLYGTLFHNAVTCGFDRREGGFFSAGLAGRRADVRVKLWWVQAEAMVCALVMYRLTGEPSAYGIFARTLDWIERRQVDDEGGEWHAVIHEDGTPFGDKATNKDGAWKTPYHDGRGVLRSLALLDELMESKG
jgi:mannobiose 2-epimerase